MRSTAIGFTEQNGLEKVVDGVPIGAIIPYAGSTAPFGTLICNGAAISRAAYPELFEAIGTTWGAGDGSTTFNIPDLRGYFLRGVGGNSAGLAVEQGDAMRRIYEVILHIRSVPTTQRVATSGQFVQWYHEDTSLEQSAPLAINRTPTAGDFWYRDILFDSQYVIPTATEIRPINKAVNYIIVYE